MARRNKRNTYDPDNYNETAALTVKAARRQAWETGTDGHRSGRTDFHGPTKGDRKDRRKANRHALMSR